MEIDCNECVGCGSMTSVLLNYSRFYLDTRHASSIAFLIEYRISASDVMEDNGIP